MLEPKTVRCAVYTRKSSDEGLEQSFNSLHAQREACEAYILSQKHEGWQLVPTEYDDGGFSGGTMERPAVKALMADIKAGLIDIVVVYKVDRLTRSLADFAKMVELFDATGASFVSITQAFNTTTSMGRLTLNVLLSFAQFEREVTGERIRDKIAASKAKGMWMGGLVPLGYDLHERALVENALEAEQVRSLFRLYLKLRSVDAVIAKADKLGIRAKLRITKAGGVSGGGVLSRSTLYKTLENTIYIGQISHGEKRFTGLHAAIVDQKLFDAVQDVIASNRTKKRGSVSAAVPAFLAGVVWRDTGERLVSTHTCKNGRRYRYYADQHTRIPADELEALVTKTLTDKLSHPANLAQLLPDLTMFTEHLAQTASAIDSKLGSASPLARRTAAMKLIKEVVIAVSNVTLVIDLAAIGAAGEASIIVPATVGRSRARLELVVPGAVQRSPDHALVVLVARARAWLADLTNGTCATFQALADRYGVSEGYARQHIGAAFLAPDLVEQIVEGRQAPSLTIASFKAMLPLPADWAEQRALFLALN